VRSTFVLGLEEQLRADLHVLRPATAGSPRGARAVRRWTDIVVRLAVPMAVALLLVGGLVAARRAAPGDMLYPVRRAIESGFTALAWSAGGRAERQLTLGEHRMADLRAAIERAPRHTQGLVAAVVGAYTEALAISGVASDPSWSDRARRETAAAARELERLASGSPGLTWASRRWLLAGSGSLGSALLAHRLGPGGGVPEAPPFGTDGAATDTAVDATSVPTASAASTHPAGAASATAVAATPGVRPLPTGVTAPATAPVPPTGGAAVPTRPPEGATATAPVGAAPSATPLQPLEPPATSPPAAPTATGQPWIAPATATGGPPATNTPDSWPVTSTPASQPTPRPPDEPTNPPPTDAAPTAGPPGEA
jgi:hypothetical protein